MSEGQFPLNDAKFRVTMIFNKLRRVANSKYADAFVLTARQYGGPSVKFRSRVFGIGIARSQNAAVAVTRREHRAGYWYFSQKVLSEAKDHGARRVWRTFCRPGTNYAEHYACRVTKLIGAANLSPVSKLVAGTGAVSRYKMSRSQKTVTVQDLYCVQVSVYGRIFHYKAVLGARAKTVTNNLPILSVLALDFIF
jgi:hypothetical protein